MHPFLTSRPLFGRLFTLVSCLFILVGCAMTRVAQLPSQQRYLNPYIGAVYDAREGVWVDADDLVKHLARSDVIYLGEVHDNPWHHAIELQLARELSDSSPIVIAFEFFAASQTPLLMEYAERGPYSEDDTAEMRIVNRLRYQLGWAHKPDALWDAYFPLLRFARERGLQVAGLDLTDGLKRRLVKNDAQMLTPLEQRMLPTPGVESPEYRALVRDILRRAHCGHGVEAYIDGLYRTWQARNSAMADSIVSLLRQQSEGPVLVVLGRAHVSYDEGVYRRVMEIVPDVLQVNIGLFGLGGDLVSPWSFERGPTVAGKTFGPSHRYIWFTDRTAQKSVSGGDPCA